MVGFDFILIMCIFYNYIWAQTMFLYKTESFLTFSNKKFPIGGPKSPCPQVTALCVAFYNIKMSHPDIWIWSKYFFHEGNSNVRNSRAEVFCKKGVLRNFPKFAGKHLCQSLFFNKVPGLRPAILLLKRPWHRCFPVNFVKFLRKSFFKEHLWLLLESQYWFWC